MEELWKDVVGFENFYEVSTLGRVRSKDRKINYKNIGTAIRKGIILSPKIGNTGYYEVVLVKFNIKKYCRIHRLVAEAFIPNPNNFSCINHKDENKLNNKVENLEWCTSKYNTEIYYNKRTILYQYDLEGNYIRTWNSITKAAEFYNIDKTGIQHCCKGLLKTYYNFIWTYNELTKENFKLRTTDNKVKVLQYSLNGVLLNTFNSMVEASSIVGCKPSFISMCCSGIRKSKKYIWKKGNL